MTCKLIASDIDGVWTDGSFYYTEEGDTMRKFSTKDSYGVKLCLLMDIPILILSTEANSIVEKRMKKLKVSHTRLGTKNKLKSLAAFCESKGISLRDVAFIGDDMNDFQLIGQVGFFACPADGYAKIRSEANLVLRTAGGEGVFREFVETILEREGKLDEAYNKYLSECSQI